MIGVDSDATIKSPKAAKSNADTGVAGRNIMLGREADGRYRGPQACQRRQDAADEKGASWLAKIRIVVETSVRSWSPSFVRLIQQVGPRSTAEFR
jgi:hypothetical protein